MNLSWIVLAYSLKIDVTFTKGDETITRSLKELDPDWLLLCEVSSLIDNAIDLLNKDYILQQVAQFDYSRVELELGVPEPVLSIEDENEFINCMDKADKTELVKSIKEKLGLDGELHVSVSLINSKLKSD